MTKTEAIVLLRELSNFVATPPETDEAISMAIEALTEEPSEDCIDRYSALAELDPSSYEYEVIKKLPSVVPKRSDEEWQR